MRNETARAAEHLRSKGKRCVICHRESLWESDLRGVAPLMQWLEDNTLPRGFCAADRVVGKAAAFLYIILGADEVWAQVISTPARETLEAAHISVFADQTVPAIRNRDNTGFCPMESAVWSMTSPAEALIAIRQTRDRLQAQ